MKGILGRKVGMTQVYSDSGKALPVTVIEVKPNVVTKVLNVDNSGYIATQLGLEDKKQSKQNKPAIGHFKKANATPKRFVKEIRGMEGYELGSNVEISIFAAGNLVDVIAVSKGKGFTGAIKRHNQSIGPKSHGGGGGSQPVRQTGSLGDISGNKVVKGMTMPGHHGNKQATIQNLEVIFIDVPNNILLVKGSIPGPKKSFVIIKEAIKGLPTKEEIKLVDVQEAHDKNELIEEAKKVGADVNTEMSVAEMKAAIEAAKESKVAAEVAKEAEEAETKAKEEAEKLEIAAEKAKADAEKAATSGNTEAIKKAEAKAELLEKQAEVAEAKAEEIKEEAREAKAEAAKAEAKADELQVETKEEIEEPKSSEKAQTKESKTKEGE